MLTPSEARAAWVKALRSDEFEQGEGALRHGDKYCCLGVACELAIRDGVWLSVTVDENNLYAYSGQTGTLPGDVRRWLDLETVDGVLKDDSETSLASTNDAGSPFSEIADIIERDDVALAS